MSLLKQIDNKGAVLEWSPVSQYANLVALGTKDSAGTGFDDHGGELELHSLNFSEINNTHSTLLGSVKSNSRFSSIAWSQMSVSADNYPYGLIAGGMVDGNIHVWDPSKVVSGEDSLLASVEQHRGAISGLHFNPHKESSHLLASGGDDLEVYVTSLERPDAPSVFIPAPPPSTAKHTAAITKVAWNTQVPHILASAAQNGSCYIWDLKSKRAWCELKDPAGGCVSDVAWNPDQGLHVITASGDDKNPVLKLWDLRSSTSLPLATLQQGGHTQGILSISWCPSDPSLLLSCGKDNRTILWDLFSLCPVYDLPSAVIPSENEDDGDQEVFGGLASAGQRRYDVKWSPTLPAVISAASFDRKIQFFSMSGAKSSIGRAPKWLRKPVGAAFGFGGKLVTFDNQNVSAAATPGGKKVGGSAALVNILQVVEDPELVHSCDRFHEAMAKGEYKQFCELKAQSFEDGTTAQERQVWSLMNVICFGSNAREELLTHLGFDSAAITTAAQEYVHSSSPKKSVTNSSAIKTDVDSAIAPVSAEDVFGLESVAAAVPEPEPTTPKHAKADIYSASPEMAAKTAELLADVLAGQAAEPTIRQAIIVGNFEAAVECCLQSGLLAEALLLAQCGDQNLRVKTQAAFFERQHRKHPFLNVLHAVIKNELMGYVASSDLTRWRETLALLSTYGKHDEFPALCEALAARLEAELHDSTSATLCFMCAANVSRTVGFWTAELVAANKEVGYCDTKALQNYIEKVVVFTHANPIDSLGPECASFFAKYGELLANQGRLDVSISYLKGDNLAESILIDRLYNAGNKPAGSRPPPFPFTRVVVEIDIPKQQQQQTVAGAVNGKQSVAVNQQPVATTSKGAATPGAAAVNRNGINPNPASRTQQVNPVAAVNQQQQQVTPSAAQSSGLPAGWVQLVDPTSGHPYYANQATGQTQWEPPVTVPAVTPKVVAPQNVAFPQQQQQVQQVQQQQVQQQQQQQQFSQQRVAPQQQQQQQQAVVAQPVVFTPSVFNPAAVQQQQPQAIAQRPEPVVTAPVTVPVPVAVAHVVSDQEAECLSTLGQYIESLAGFLTIPAEKKQIGMVRVAHTALTERISSGDMSDEVLQKLVALIQCLLGRNFQGASVIQTDLANTAWNLHKEWIKGVKILIQLASKK